MELDLTFKAVCDSLKDGADDTKLIDAVDSLLGFTIVCAPIALGPAGVALLPMLRVKNELTKIGKRVFRAATRKGKDNDYSRRFHQMQAAHGLLVYTAFFEALDQTLPSDLRRRMDVQAEERRALARIQSEPCQTDDPNDSQEPQEEDAAVLPESGPLADVPISFPHPTQSLPELVEAHRQLWKQLADGVWGFIQMLAVWDEMKDDERKALRKLLDEIPTAAGTRFVEQYVGLAQKFPDFAIWANLHEHVTTHEKMTKLATHVRAYFELHMNSQKAVDLGLVALQGAITSLPDKVTKADATGLMEGLSRHYAARLNDPIIEDKYQEDVSGPRLKFPKVKEAFVPQPFRVVRHTGQALHLEDERTWSDLPRRDDLGPFLLRYLSSPYSTESPLLVLGHPGSGKSLLTTVLAAQLAKRHHSVVRVPLREVPADVGIVAQIEDAIAQVTTRRVDSWSKLSAVFRDHPPVVILDGYDELLQASGRVYAGYLREAKGFQKSEAEQGRPVRVIVTSRVTLIDKARVPPGSTVLRLLEFDDPRQSEWISVWNCSNAAYFKEAGVEEFQLPDKAQQGAEKILSLAEQPLLLLMLALYDSQDNQLRKSISLDRTRLYDELLRRFVRRERGKDSSFHDDLDPDAQVAAIDEDMRRLGVAAIGMYNRRQVHILANQLEADLKFFDLVKQVAVTEGRPMSQADLLLGSFFFVHKSQAKSGTESEGAADADASAFEFLHNTLGEFLTADFILRWAIEEVKALATLSGQAALLSMFHDRLNSPDGLPRQWFASLIYTPLFTRPLVLEMMREWSGHLLDRAGMSRATFADQLDTVLHKQIERLISKRAMPSIMRKETVDERFRARFGDHPLVGHIAVYSVNLLLLRLIVHGEPFIMDEGAIESYEDGARPWDRLVHLWRSWFSLEALNGLTAVLESARKGPLVELRAKNVFQVAESHSRLEVLVNVSMAVADDLSAGVSGLALSEVVSSQVLGLEGLAHRLDAERIEAPFQLAVRALQEVVRAQGGGRTRVLVERASDAMGIAVRDRPRDDAERVAQLFASGVRGSLGEPSRRREGPSARRHHRLRGALEPATNLLFIAHMMEKSPEAALIWVRSIKLLAGDLAFRGPDGDELIDRLAHGGPPVWELFRESPTSIVAWVETLKELGLPLQWRRGPRGLFERFFHPGMMMELFEQSPESALALLQAVHELGGESERFWRHLEPEVLQRLLDPRYLLDLSERSPEAATSLARLLREWGDGRLLREVEPERARSLVSDFVERAMGSPYLFDLAERSPETALELIRVVRALGGRDALRGPMMHPGMLERLSDGRFFVRLSERSPEAVVVMVQLLRELGGESERFWRHLEPEVLQRLLDPRYLLDLSERSPEAATSLARLLRQWGDGRLLREMEPDCARSLVRDLVERAMGSPYLFDLAERSPETALELIRVVRALGGRDTLRGPMMHPGMLERLSDGRFFVRLSERSPEAVVVMVQLLRELGWGSRRMWRRMGPELAERLLDPRTLLEISERSPEAALLLTGFWDDRDGDSRGPLRFGRMWHPGHIEAVLDEWLSSPSRDSRGFAAALRLARALPSPVMTGRLAEAIAQAIRRDSLLDVLPMGVLADLYWLASEGEAGEAREVIRDALPGSTNADLGVDDHQIDQ